MQRFSLPNGGTLTYVTRADWEAGPFAGGEPIPEGAATGLVLHQTPDLPKAMAIQRPTATDDIEEAIRFMDRLQTVRPDLNNEVPYSWVIMQGFTDADAIVCEGRGRNRSGAHTAGMNHERYGVAVAQNTDDEPMTEGQIEAFRWLGREFITAEDVDPTGGHSDFAHVHRYNATECPGDNGRATLDRLQPPFDGTPAPPAAVAIEPNHAAGVTGVSQPLQRGDSGPMVRNWQRLLIAIGFPLPEFGADSDFGEETEEATKAFERSIALDDDGRVSVEQARLAMNVYQQQQTGEAQLKPEPTPEPSPPAPADISALDAARGHLVALHKELNQAQARVAAALESLNLTGQP